MTTRSAPARIASFTKAVCHSNTAYVARRGILYERLVSVPAGRFRRNTGHLWRNGVRPKALPFVADRPPSSASANLDSRCRDGATAGSFVFLTEPKKIGDHIQRRLTRMMLHRDFAELISVCQTASPTGKPSEA